MSTIKTSSAIRMATAVAASALVAAEINTKYSDKDRNAEEPKINHMYFTTNTRSSVPVPSKSLMGKSNMTNIFHLFGIRNNHKTLCESIDIKGLNHPDNKKMDYQEIEDEKERFEKCLTHHRQLLNEYKEKWDYVANRTSRIPTTQWPAYPDTLPFPHTTQLNSLFPELTYCHRSPNYQNDQTSYCQPIQFQIAYILLSQQQTMQQKESLSSEVDEAAASVQYGWSLLKELAESGHADAMCLYAQTLNNGHALIPLEPDPVRAVAWLHHCNSLHPNHAPTLYELGVAYYVGEGTTEDEHKAVQIYFQKAAHLNHAGAAYMLGDSILDGVGCVRDRALALEWLIKSGDLGHRGARSRVLAVLEYDDSKDYGEFTDASRQTLKKNQNKTKDTTRTFSYEPKDVSTQSNMTTRFTEDLDIDAEADMEESEETEEEEEARHWAEVRKNVYLNERKFTIGGTSNIQILKKRRTVVLESRDSSGKS